MSFHVPTMVTGRPAQMFARWAGVNLLFGQTDYQLAMQWEVDQTLATPWPRPNIFRKGLEQQAREQRIAPNHRIIRGAPRK